MREAPDVDGGEQLFDDLVRIETRLYNSVNEQLRPHGITASSFEVLQYIGQHPHCRIGDVAAAFAIGVGSTSKAIDRLQTAELVIRVSNPADRRSSLLALTGEGDRRVEEALPVFRAAIAASLGTALSPGEISHLAAVLRPIRSSLEAADIGSPAG